MKIKYLFYLLEEGTYAKRLPAFHRLIVEAFDERSRRLHRGEFNADVGRCASPAFVEPLVAVADLVAVPAAFCHSRKQHLEGLRSINLIRVNLILGRIN